VKLVTVKNKDRIICIIHSLKEEPTEIVIKKIDVGSHVVKLITVILTHGSFTGLKARGLSQRRPDTVTTTAEKCSFRRQ
jgi:hypothetical protein